MESASQPTCRVAIVEDHVLQRERTESLITSTQGFALAHSAHSLPDFVAWAKSVPREVRPHVLILDLMIEREPNVDVDVVEELIAGGLKVVVLSALASPALVRRVVRAGVHAIVGKRDPEDDIVAALHAVIEHREWMTTELASVIASDPDRPKLSGQEERALILYATGLTLDEVAAAIGVQRDTARQYLDRVRAKYEAAGRPARTKLELSKIAWADGYVDPFIA